MELELEAVRALQQQGVPIQVGHEDNGDDGDGDDDDDTSGDEKNNVMDGIPPKENDKVRDAHTHDSRKLPACITRKGMPLHNQSLPV